MKNHNIFITFEGGEGAGKSSVLKKVIEELNNRNIPVVKTREPGGNKLEFQKDIRNMIMSYDNLDTITELLLFEADRREHITKVIKPALAEGKMVISDRFSDSTTVYQGFVKGLPRGVVEAANNIVTADSIPNLTFIFDIDPEVAQTRIGNGDRNRNRFDNESIAFHTKVRDAFLKLAEEDNKRYKVIDASKSLEEVVKQVEDIIYNDEIINESIINKNEKTIKIQESINETN